MAKTSQGSVRRPSFFWFFLLDGGIILLALLAFNDRAYERASERLADRLPPRETLVGMLIGTAVIHVVEAMAAGRIARKRGLAPVGWRVQTLVVGFPSLLALRKTKSA
jgi:Domain of unknown function (DUF4499)